MLVAGAWGCKWLTQKLFAIHDDAADENHNEIEDDNGVNGHGA